MRNFTNLWRATVCLLLVFSTISGSAFAAFEGEGKGAPDNLMAWRISGTVTDINGEPLPGVSVIVKGSTPPVGASTDLNGRYNLSVPENPGTLVFSFIGYVSEERPYTGPGEVNVQLNEDIQALEEVVVTGYSTERKKDIVGSVSVVRSEELLQTPSANLQQQLQGRAAGVMVSGNGQPGGGAKVRIRGFASFGNNDPLYVIDGVPTENPALLNPQDIESMQVLKDATASSIYGSRAANGVIIITTKKGKAGQSSLTVNSYYGVQVIPESVKPDMMNTAQYGEYLQKVNPGVAHPVYGTDGTIPPYILVSDDLKGGVSASGFDPSRYNISPNGEYYQVMETSPGTDWFGAVTRPARIQSHQISAAGGSEAGTYSLGVNYFNQEGTFIHTGYDRFTVRANTTFNPIKGFRIGENLQVSYEDRQGTGNVGEGGAWGMAQRMVPYLPVYDINGNFAGNRVGNSGNSSNPVADLTRAKDNKNYGYNIFGNVFGEVDIIENLTARTSFGLDYGNNFQQNYQSSTYERSENISNNSYAERFGYGYSWTWTNTLNYSTTIAELHSLKFLAGVEAIQGTGRRIVGQVTGLEFGDDINFRSLSRGTGVPVVNTEAAEPYALYSQFGKIDYIFNDKYLFNATVRRDGSSKFGEDNRFGVFPAVGFGWRLSEEGFMQGISWLDDLKLRGGWGQMGSQKNVNPSNSYSFFSSARNDGWYDISGANTGAVPGYRPSQLGNVGTKWETTETTNVGLDATLFNGRITLGVEYFNIDTKDLLVERVAHPLEGQVRQPSVNVGTMRNRGVDLNLGARGKIAGDVTYDINWTFTHFTNTAVSLAEGVNNIDFNIGSRLTQVSRTTAGRPVGSFYGYEIDGFTSEGAWNYVDHNNDGKITDDDKTFIGSPIPDFQTGLNLSFAYKNFDLTSFLFLNYGNELYNFNKWFTHVRGFVGGYSTDVLNDSWTPNNPNASLPALDKVDGSNSNSFYVEDGSYLRLRTLQLGYTLPAFTAGNINVKNLRIYLQGQNLFTITNYTGVDPDLSIQSETGSAMNGQDQPLLMGIDVSGFPQPRQFLFGLNIGI